jgi:hypothetical protein
MVRHAYADSGLSVSSPVSSEQAALQLLQQIKYSGLTPLGTSMDQKILQPLVLGPAQQNRLQKPVLIIAITGQCRPPSTHNAPLF